MRHVQLIVLMSTALAALAAPAIAKLPPLSDEAKVKAAEAAAKTAHGNKVADFQLCKSMDKVASKYFATAKATGKEPKPAAETPPCADPGTFAPSPPASAPAAAAATPTAAAKKS